MPFNPLMGMDPSMGFMSGESLGIPAAIGGGGYNMPHIAPPHVNMGNNAAHNQMMQMRMLRYMRPLFPEHDSNGRQSHRGNPLLGGDSGADFTQVMRSQAARQQANDMLGQYGLSLPEDINPNAFLPNSGFFGRHQKLAAMLEGGVLGGIHGAENGTIMGGVAGGLQALGDRRNAVNAQLAAPFGMWQQMANMEKESTQIDDMRALADERRRKAQDPMSKFYSVHQDKNTGLLVGMGPKGLEELPGQRDTSGAPKYDFGSADKPPKYSQGVTDQLYIMGVDPKTATPAQLDKANKAYLAQQKDLFGFRASASFREGDKDPAEIQRLFHNADSDMTGMLLDPKNKGEVARMISQGVPYKEVDSRIQAQNNAIRRSRSDWEQEIRAGKHTTPFINWYQSRGSNGSPMPQQGGGAPPAGGGSALQQLLNEAHQDKAQRSAPANPMAQPKQLVDPSQQPSGPSPVPSSAPNSSDPSSIPGLGLLQFYHSFNR